MTALPMSASLWESAFSRMFQLIFRELTLSPVAILFLRLLYVCSKLIDRSKAKGQPKGCPFAIEPAKSQAG